MTDRHGRVTQADVDRRRRPASGFRLRGNRRFAELVDDCIGALPAGLQHAASQVHLAIADVPAEDGPGARVAVYDPVRRQLTVFRRMAELRAITLRELTEVVRDALAAELRTVSGTDVADS